MAFLKCIASIAKKIEQMKAIQDAKNAKKGRAKPAKLVTKASHNSVANVALPNWFCGISPVRNIKRCGRNVAVPAANNKARAAKI